MKGASLTDFAKLSKSFISHMVQMKDRREYNPPARLYALYPTWFRWKSVDDCLLTVKVFLYIPHGSDERTFFWKRRCLYRVLYIPHGSDERVALGVYSKAGETFISHMVQMKVR